MITIAALAIGFFLGAACVLGWILHLIRRG